MDRLISNWNGAATWTRRQLLDRVIYLNRDDNENVVIYNSTTYDRAGTILNHGYEEYPKGMDPEADSNPNPNHPMCIIRSVNRQQQPILSQRTLR